RTFQNEKSQPVNCRPGEILRPRSVFGWNGSRVHKQVQSGPKKFKRIETTLSRATGVGVAGGGLPTGEGRAEQTRFCQRKSEISSANSTQLRSGQFRPAFPARNPSKLRLNRASKRGE